MTIVDIPQSVYMLQRMNVGDVEAAWECRGKAEQEAIPS